MCPSASLRVAPFGSPSTSLRVAPFGFPSTPLRVTRSGWRTQHRQSCGERWMRACWHIAKRAPKLLGERSSVEPDGTGGERRQGCWQLFEPRRGAAGHRCVQRGECQQPARPPEVFSFRYDIAATGGYWPQEF